MMSGANSDEAVYVPSMMGLEGRILKQQHLWDCWETNSHNLNNTPTVPNTTNLLSHAFFTAAPLPPPPPPTFLDCTAPPLLFPVNSSFPFYSEPQVAPECALGLNKSEDGVGGDRGRIGLNLGHRTYFSSADAFAIDRLFARSRGMYSLSHHKPPRCQAEGCKADLSGAKHYHRRHKVCEFHSKASVVVAAGLQQRFCQQCSRFHVLAEFDEAKRSCRKRLADHNRRRRKPQLPAATSESSSSKKEQSSKPTEKCKQIPKVSRDRSSASTSKSTTTACTSTNNSTSIRLEGQQSYQNKGNQLRNVAALSLGGVGPVEQVGMVSASLYQRGQGSFVSVSQGKFSQPKQQQQGNNTSSAASNSTFFHHHTLFSSNETSQTTEIGGAGHCTSQHQSGLLHLGQVMFEVDSV